MGAAAGAGSSLETAEDSMADSKRLAGLVGPTIVAMTASETLNLHIWAANDPRLTYLDGTILFVVGLSILRAHNRWAGWPVLVTLVGWFAVALGLFRMFAPEARVGGVNTQTHAFIAVLFAAGAYLTYQAYRREEHAPDVDQGVALEPRTGR